MIEPRPEVAGTAPAVHGGPAGGRDRAAPVDIDFSTAINAWGPAPAVLVAARGASVEHYPDPECLAAREAAAGRWGRPLEEICFGAGAAELLFAVCFAYLRPGDRVVVPRPGFGEYARGARICGGTVVDVDADRPGLRIDPGAFASSVREHRPRLAFLCAPSNPTGQAFGQEDVRRVADACRAAGTLLVLDQSYDAFLAEPLGTPALPGHPAVLCVRSVTKDHALAGVRAGYAVGPADVISAVERARAPWAASAAAQAAAVAALGPVGEEHLRFTLPKLRAERERLEREAVRLGIATVPTRTHFFLLRVGDGAGAARRLRAEFRLGVRDCASFGLPEHVRVAARRPEENDRLLEALEAVCSA